MIWSNSDAPSRGFQGLPRLRRWRAAQHASHPLRRQGRRGEVGGPQRPWLWKLRTAFSWFIELDDGKILTGNPYIWWLKTHGFPVNFPLNQSNHWSWGSGWWCFLFLGSSSLSLSLVAKIGMPAILIYRCMSIRDFVSNICQYSGNRQVRVVWRSLYSMYAAYKLASNRGFQYPTKNKNCAEDSIQD